MRRIAYFSPDWRQACSSRSRLWRRAPRRRVFSIPPPRLGSKPDKERCAWSPQRRSLAPLTALSLASNSTSLRVGTSIGGPPATPACRRSSIGKARATWPPPGVPGPRRRRLPPADRWEGLAHLARRRDSLARAAALFGLWARDDRLPGQCGPADHRAAGAGRCGIVAARRTRIPHLQGHL